MNFNSNNLAADALWLIKAKVNSSNLFNRISILSGKRVYFSLIILFFISSLLIPWNGFSSITNSYKTIPKSHISV